LNSVQVTNLADYIKKISELNSTLGCDGFGRRDILLFRGQADKDYELLPAIGRYNGFCQKVNFSGEDEYCTFTSSMLLEERNLIEMAKYKIPDVFSSDMQPIELLALLQHHGIPTRLLDVTESALVALYFACCSLPDKDGEVFAFKNNEYQIANSPIINAIADSYRFSIGDNYTLSQFYSAVKVQPYFLEQVFLLGLCNQSDVEGEEWVEECCENPIFVFAPVHSLRQRVQRGRYILFHDEIVTRWDGQKVFSRKINPICKDAKFILGKFIIPAENKKQFLSDLQICGIDEESLFCDSIDKVCENITKYSKDKVSFYKKPTIR